MQIHLDDQNISPKLIYNLRSKILLDKILFLILRGPGVADLGMVKIEFYVVSNRGGPQLPDAFYRIKKYCFYPK